MSEQAEQMTLPLAGDAHCHLSFACNGEELAEDSARSSLLMFNNTVDPHEWLTAQVRFAGYPTILNGFGMHPWWVSNDMNESTIVELLDEHRPDALGEIGLDFSTMHEQTREIQLRIFEAMTAWAARQGGRLLSIHAVRSASEALDILQRVGALESCICLFHWFSGLSNDLHRALRAGCYFSINERMIKSKKGREYVKAIPANRLLLESDLPSEPNEFLSFKQLQGALERTAIEIAALKGDEVLPVIMNRTKELLSRGGNREQ